MRRTFDYLSRMFGMVGILLCASAGLIAAQEGSLFVSIRQTERGPAPIIMVNVMRDGEIVRQQEEQLYLTSERLVLFKLPIGSYDVLIQGEGLQTEIKRGILVLSEYDGESLRNTKLHFVVRPGEGTHVVEYLVDGLTRVGLEQRIGNLEAAIESLTQSQ